ncbi:MAG: Pyruvate kinase [Candidatus Magnetoglobus multicellularis str. Araruama]|uniref:Pyruvate kinase n=1 Tax=Candidatus Magnetoglobus multicellularis str. Araruama TaxID=890399 RepID=A0A1V1P9U1_9BACT|nr:MAG: Pyruvate kinase [Candidatus Magnetoglobus multicellularis str. Araruama]
MLSITQSKIICTMGPSCHTPEQIRCLADLGMDCTRINFSHGTHEEKIQIFENVRTADDRLAILCDIQGPKIRIGKVEGSGILLKQGHTITVTTDPVEGNKDIINISYEKLPQEASLGDLIYINDGLVCLKIKKIQDNNLLCDILTGGFISTKKGVNLPSTQISLTVPTEKDIDDLKLIARLDPEYVAISFVNDANDIATIRKILADAGNPTIKLIAKIERPFALVNFDEILAESDGIMIARGDLGVEIAPEDVQPVQKELIRKCNIAGKPVIVATQMLESMTHAPTPTRAEVSDVYNAIDDGADAVMLSAETASGKYPEKAVGMMERIIRSAETHMTHADPDDLDSPDRTHSELIGHLVFSACKDLCENASGKIICLTKSGYSARMISKYRPYFGMFGITDTKKAARVMRMTWGVEPVVLPQLETVTANIDRIRLAADECYKRNFIGKDEKVIVTGNHFFNFQQETNMLCIYDLKDILSE